MILEFKNGKHEIDSENNDVEIIDTCDKNTEKTIIDIGSEEQFTYKKIELANGEFMEHSICRHHCYFVQQTPKQPEYLTKEDLRTMRFICDDGARYLITLVSGGLICYWNSKMKYSELIRSGLKWSTGLFDELKSFRKDGK